MTPPPAQTTAPTAPATVGPTTATTAPAPGAPGNGGILETITSTPLPLLVVFLGLFYFMIIRPQQKRAKDHQSLVGAIGRGDTVVLSNGVIGKVSKVEDTELGVEIATGVVVKVVKAMVSDVRGKNTPSPAPANDAAPSGGLLSLFGGKPAAKTNAAKPAPAKLDAPKPAIKPKSTPPKPASPKPAPKA